MVLALENLNLIHQNELQFKVRRDRGSISFYESAQHLHKSKGYSAIEQFSMILNINPFSNSSEEYSKILENKADKGSQNILVECRILVKRAYEKLDLDKLKPNEVVTDRSSDCENEEHSHTSNENRIVTENGKKSTGVFEKRVRAKERCINIEVGYDGFWTTRGHRSKHGFGSVIDILTRFGLVFAIVFKFCQPFALFGTNDLDEDSVEFSIWYVGHVSDCPIYHSGSSGAIEASAAEIIWKRSVTYGYRFTTILSDGDSLTFNHRLDLDIY